LDWPKAERASTGQAWRPTTIHLSATQSLLFLQQISSKTPPWAAAFIASAQICAQSTLPNRPHPCSACFIRSRSGASNSLIENR
jgi:hypothetical protein